jgi:RNA polymerase sigma factor (sigma-70 family)
LVLRALRPLHRAAGRGRNTEAEMSSSAALATERPAVALRLPRSGKRAEPPARRSDTAPADGAAVRDPRDADPNIRHFKQMHACLQRMAALRDRHGAAAVQREDYGQEARVHQELRGRIAADNLGLVYSLCRRKQMAAVDGDDLLSEGLAALVRAIDTFNPWCGYRFSTYACTSIIHAIYRCAKREAQRRRREPFSFESPLERSRWRETRHDEDRHCYRERLNVILASGAARLTLIEADVLARRFPLNPDVAPMTLGDIGRQMRLSKERVRQVQNSGLAKLREALDRDPVLGGAPLEVRKKCCVG